MKKPPPAARNILLVIIGSLFLVAALYFLSLGPMLRTVAPHLDTGVLIITDSGYKKRTLVELHAAMGGLYTPVAFLQRHGLIPDWYWDYTFWWLHGTGIELTDIIFSP